MTYHDTVTTAVDTIGRFASQHTELAAIIVAFLASYILYGVLGKRALEAVDVDLVQPPQ